MQFIIYNAFDKIDTLFHLSLITDIDISNLVVIFYTNLDSIERRNRDWGKISVCSDFVCKVFPYFY